MKRILMRQDRLRGETISKLRLDRRTIHRPHKFSAQENIVLPRGVNPFVLVYRRTYVVLCLNLSLGSSLALLDTSQQPNRSQLALKWPFLPICSTPPPFPYSHRPILSKFNCRRNRRSIHLFPVQK